QRERVVARIARSDNDEDNELFEAELGKLKNDRAVALHGLEEIDAQIKTVAVVLLDEEKLAAAIKFFKGRGRKLKDTERRTLLEILGVKVIIGDSDCAVQVPGVGTLPKSGDVVRTTSTNISGIPIRRATFVTLRWRHWTECATERSRSTASQRPIL